MVVFFFIKKIQGFISECFLYHHWHKEKALAKKILAAAENYAMEHSCSSIHMTVITVREKLIAWYEKNGYRKTGKILPFPVDERFGIPTQPLEMLVLEKHL